ncbi:MAG: hypothetical protein QOH49_4763 [Acidobacteriota bacterium]|jgi:hypothetical protein|nr:hypothetical protein [Acidobacteriota bacterium]
MPHNGFVKLLIALLTTVIIISPSLLPRQSFAQDNTQPNTARRFEYLWYEAENMGGLSLDARNEPRIYPVWQNLLREKAPGWGINGPGVSAEWTQGGESEWNSVAASPDETRATLLQDVEIPRDGQYRVWARYADWARKAENFTVRLTQQGREVFRQEFGARDVIDPHDEVSMYWGWAFAWDGSPAASLKKGPARLSIEIEKAAAAHRQVDCVLVTDDPDYRPVGRRKPPFPAQRVLSDWALKRTPLTPLLEKVSTAEAPPVLWRRPALAGRDFLMPWNISETFWDNYEKPTAERPLYPFNAEPPEAFVEKYKGARDVPIFNSPLVVPVVHLNNLPRHLKEGSAFLNFIRQTHSPFAVNINYGTATFPETEGAAALKLLEGELRGQFVGWISGESIGHVYSAMASRLTLTPDMSRRAMLEAYRAAYTRALEEKWAGTFQTPAGAQWDKLIPAQSTSSTAFSHALFNWGVRTLGMETAAVQPVTAMRVAFVRGAARQYGGNFLYYHAPNFGDTATTFTKQQNFAGPDQFFHSRYGTTMGPSLSWYRKSYYLYYMSGASAVYLEQGFDQFFKPGPGEHPFQLNPLGRITEEFVRFAQEHAERGTPYTPIAFLLDPAHGWDMTDYPQLPLGVSPVNRSDRALRELFLAAYHPAAIDEGEPATADRQAFTNSVFGDIFDVLVADEKKADAVDAYRALVVGGRIEWTPAWAARLKAYVEKGGTVVVNAAQAKGLPAELLGVRATGATAEADDATCLAPGEPKTDLRGQVYRYERVEPRGAEVLMQAPSGDPLITVNRVGRGRVVYCAVPDLLGLDERLVPAAAHLLAHLASDATPVRVRGEVEYLVNRNARGWVVTLINNRGVYKSQQGLAQVNRAESAEVTLEENGAAFKRATEWTTGAELNVSGGRVSLNIPPGGVRIVELLP